MGGPAQPSPSAQQGPLPRPRLQPDPQIGGPRLTGVQADAPPMPGANGEGGQHGGGQCGCTQHPLPGAAAATSVRRWAHACAAGLDLGWTPGSLVRAGAREPLRAPAEPPGLLYSRSPRGGSAASGSVQQRTGVKADAGDEPQWEARGRTLRDGDGDGDGPGCGGRAGSWAGGAGTEGWGPMARPGRDASAPGPEPAPDLLRESSGAGRATALLGSPPSLPAMPPPSLPTMPPPSLPASPAQCHPHHCPRCQPHRCL